MKKEEKINYKLLVKVIGAVVALSGAIVMFGWFLDIAVLKSILPGFVTMKFITALSFFLSGILIILMTEKDDEISNYFVLIISFVIILWMTAFFISLFLGISVGIENLFVKEAEGAVKTTVPGVPAIPTMLCFIFIALAGLVSYANSNISKTLSFIGIIIAVLGGIAVIGYLINVPVLYYTFEGYTSMALNTAILFVLAGIGLVLIGKKKENEAVE